MKETDFEMFVQESNGVSPGLMKRHNLSISAVLVADFSPAAKDAVRQAVPKAKTIFDDLANKQFIDDEDIESKNEEEMLLVMNEAEHARYLESLDSWRHRFAEGEWINVVALSTNRVRNVSGTHLPFWIRLLQIHICK